MKKIIILLLISIFMLSFKVFAYKGSSEFTPIPNKSKFDNFLTLKVKKGDTLFSILQNSGISQSDAHNAIYELKKIFSVKDLKVNQEIKLYFAINDLSQNNIAQEIEFSSLNIKLSHLLEIEVIKLDDDLFFAREIKIQPSYELVQSVGNIQSSLYKAAYEANVPDKVILNLIKILSYDVDFQRDIRKGNEFKILFERMLDENGNIVDSGNIISASLVLNNRELNIYRFESEDGVDYYNQDGKTVRKSLLRTPVDGARVTSGFGKRRHPTLGYTKLHKGIDFGAPTGTPIYSAGDGVIEYLGRRGSYGKYVKIKHKNGYSTAYAHLSRYNKRLKKGSRVKQGMVIGYVGSTGRSTGPHLHYEILVNNRQINPLSVKSLPGKSLKGLKLAIFKDYVEQVEDLAFNSPVLAAKTIRQAKKEIEGAFNLP